MKSPSIPPFPTRTERFSTGLGAVLVALSVFTLGGWWLGLDELLQPFGVYAPLKINAALSFGLLGATLLATAKNDRRFAVIAALPLGLGLAAVIEHLLGHDLRINQLLGPDRFIQAGESPGRMGMVDAVGIGLAAAVCLWRLSARGERTRWFVQAMIGSLLASAGLSILLGYAADLPVVYKWGGDTPTSPVAAVAMLLAGACLLSFAWRDSLKVDGNAPAWSPMPAVIACLTLTVVLWIGLRAREEIFTTQTTQAEMDKLATLSKESLDRQVSLFERIARVWSDAPANAISVWDADASRQLTQDAGEYGCTLIAFVNMAYRTTWVFPRAGNESLLGFDHSKVESRISTIHEAETSGGRPFVAMDVPIRGAKGPEKGFVIYAPVIRSGETAGFVAAEFSYRTFFHTVATTKARLAAAYHVVITMRGESVFQNSTPHLTRNPNLIVHRTYNLADRRMRLTLEPTDAAITQSRRYLPELALGAGFGISALLGLSIHLARSARSGQRAAELLNKRLSAENEERRRIEGRLKISDERLRLALDSTQIGIFEWTVSTGHVYYSSGLWAMLGYEHSRMPSTVETWQSLIHPDDLAYYRRRTESQLHGVASFIEPEYRVRARTGEWRWVYTRSKSVTTTDDGRPLRIIGTVQDITARREAELALRESQSEARKLSLVAAKTDSPVLIGSPDGRIEWANEAFCRVMEYPLSEVIGKNPAHFMIGPDTNARTLAKIRAAMSRGEGISTDVVNYSKSGRKYHLHVEIQPVHGASGELENFIAIETDITGRVETETQLRRAKAEADDASRAKSEFLASMSHEIRTPMNGVIGMTSLLLETRLNEEQRDYVSTIRTSGEALLTIINDILDFSKIESGKMELDHSPFELSLCLEDALDLFALQAAAKKLEIGYHIATDVPTWIVGDVTRLRQVIVNLVNNAVKFTPSGSVSVEVRRARNDSALPGFAPGTALHSDETILEFSVRDTGIGIPPAGIERLFKAFSQVDSSTTRKYGGTGLGLAISQQLCQLMGGNIRVESGTGQGTAFIFTISTRAAPSNSSSGLSTTPEPLRGNWVLCVEDHPVTQARLKALVENWGVETIVVADASAALAAAAKRPKPPALLIIDAAESLDGPAPLEALSSIKCPRMLLMPFGQTPAVPADGQPCAHTTKPLRTIAFVLGIVGLFQSVARGASGASKVAERPIGEEIPLEVLLAEDNAVNQKVALRFLERLGYRADAVANGLEAVTTLQNRRYDLVLMDLQMPEMDGFEATRQIRRRLPATRQPKIIALTANAMQGDRELCVASGMDDYITKPVKMHEIAETIRRHFGKNVESAAPQLTS
jgi:PAS domain S-box-containing protein